MGVHSPQEHQQGRPLGAAVQHVGLPPDGELRLPLIHGGQLTPLVRHPHTEGGAALPVGDGTDQIPQQGGLSASRWREEQCALEHAPTPQPVQDRRGEPRHLPGHPDGQRGELPQISHLPIPHHAASTDADAVPAAYGKKAVAHPFQRRMGGGLSGNLQHQAQIHGTHRRLRTRNRPLTLRADQSQWTPRPQAELLHPGLACPIQPFHRPPEMGRQQSRRLAEPDCISFFRHTLTSFFCTWHIL